MDRRSFVVGGGAAALATTLAAVAGGRTLSAEASAISAGPASTAEHVRLFLESVNIRSRPGADLGVVNPDAAQARLRKSFAAYLASAPRDPKANDLHSWAQQRVADLTGAETFETVLSTPQTRTLLAFGFLVYTQHQNLRLPKAARSMPVPARLAALEPDFFPELLTQLEVKSKTSPAFADLLQAGSAELDRFIATTSDGLAFAAASDNRGLEGATLVILLFLAVSAVVEKRSK